MDTRTPRNIGCCPSSKGHFCRPVPNLANVYGSQLQRNEKHRGLAAAPVSQFAPSTTLTQHLGMTDAKHQYQTDAVGVGRTAGRGVGVDTRVNDGLLPGGDG